MNHSIYSSSFLPNESESIPTYSGGYPSYSEYPHPSKLEAFDYNYWPATTTHNLLSSSNEAILDQIPVSSSSSSSASSASNLPMESLVPISTVNLTQINTNNSISSTHHHHHHHHIHQHMYPPALVSATPPNCHDPSSWMATPADYPALHSNPVDPSHYRHYSTPCSSYSTQHFYDPTPSASQWPTAPLMPIKYESPYTPPSYFESSDSFHQPAPETPKKDEGQSDSSDQSHWLKPSSTSTPLSVIPPRNPLNGKTRTRDKYRIVYTDQQRCELENEFNISHYISIPRKAALSVTLKLSERQIKIWFQNRRAKERKLNKRRSEASGSARPSNHSHDGDSQSEAGPESPHYYPHCSS